MKKIADLIQKEDSKQNLQFSSSESKSEETENQKEVSRYNDSVGNLTDYDCDICHNKGHIMVIQEGYPSLIYCKCAALRRSKQYLKKSGLDHVSEKYSLDTYLLSEEWQKQAKLLALDFISNPVGKSFYVSGQVGSGKTHLCSGIVLNLIESGIESRYQIWPELTSYLKRHLYDGDEYLTFINKLQNAPVLYIDDFFKSDTGKEPSPKDVSIAFEILNFRYNNRDKLVTIISSELSINDLLDIDEAIGSRIFQMTRGYNINISKNIEKNYRLKDDDMEINNGNYKK